MIIFLIIRIIMKIHNWTDTKSFLTCLRSHWIQYWNRMICKGTDHLTLQNVFSYTFLEKCELWNRGTKEEEEEEDDDEGEMETTAPALPIVLVSRRDSFLRRAEIGFLSPPEKHGGWARQVKMALEDRGPTHRVNRNDINEPNVHKPFTVYSSVQQGRQLPIYVLIWLTLCAGICWYIMTSWNTFRKYQCFLHWRTSQKLRFKFLATEHNWQFFIHNVCSGKLHKSLNSTKVNYKKLQMFAFWSWTGWDPL